MPKDLSARITPDLRLGGAVSITSPLAVSISADQNDWNPTGFATAHLVQITPSGANRTITGMVPGSLPNRRVILVNVSAALNLTLKHSSASSSSANRFYNGNAGAGDIVLGPYEALELLHDTSAAGGGTNGGTNGWIPIGRVAPAVLSQAYASGDFTSDVGTFVVDSADLSDFSYSINGKLMTVWVRIINATITGTPQILKILIPAGKTANRGQSAAWPGNNAGDKTYMAITNGTKIEVWTGIGATAHANVTNAFYLYGQMTLEIQ